MGRNTLSVALVVGLISGFACLTGMRVSAQPQETPQDAEKKAPEAEQKAPEVLRLEGSFQKFLNGLADAHAKRAGQYKSAGAIGDAISQCRWALKLEPKNDKAMRELGYAKRGDAWVPDKLLEEPPAPKFEEMTEADLKAWNARQEQIEKACAPVDAAGAAAAAKAANDLLDWHRKAGRAGAAEVQARALALAGWYGQGNASVGKARKMVERDGAQVTPEVAAMIDAARKALSDAPPGNVLAVVDAQATALGWANVVRVGTGGRAFSVRTITGSVRAHRLHRVCWAIESRMKELMKDSGGVDAVDAAYLLTEVESQAQYTEFVRAHGPQDKAEMDLALKLSGYWHGNPDGYIVYRRSGTAEEGDDHLGHSAAASVTGALRGRWPMPWICRGMGYMQTAHVLGTTLTPFYQVVKEEAPAGRTAVRSRKVGASSPIDTNRKLSGPARLRIICKEMVVVKGDVTFEALSATKANDMTEHHVAKSMSLMEWLTARHPKVLAEWLGRRHASDATDLDALLKGLGMDAEKLQAGWEAWVLEAY